MTLTCSLDPSSLLGYAIPSLEWYKLESNALPRGRSSIGPLGSTLTITKAKVKADQGDYVCSASDGFVTKTDQGKVIVKG